MLPLNLFESGFVLVQTSLSTTLKQFYQNYFRSGNHLFTTFKDFPKFLYTKTSFGTDWDSFGNIPNLESVDFSFITSNFGSRTLHTCPKLTDCGILNATTFGDRCFEEDIAIDRLIFTNVTTFTYRIAYATNAATGRTWKMRYVLILTNTMATLGTSSNTTAAILSFCYRTKPIYVPDDLVASYKAATNWSSFSSVLKPLSQFAIDFPNEEDWVYELING